MFEYVLCAKPRARACGYFTRTYNLYITTSRLGTQIVEFSSSRYPVTYLFSDFLVRPGTSGLKLPVQPRSSCHFQELLGFYQEAFWMMGQFWNKRNESRSKNAGYFLKEEFFFLQGWFLIYLRSFSNMYIISPTTTTSQPIKGQCKRTKSNQISWSKCQFPTRIRIQRISLVTHWPELQFEKYFWFLIRRYSHFFWI